jgi:Fe-S cluster assembly protein SufD
VSLSLPSPREEAWRWSDLSALPALAAASPTGGTVDAAAQWLGLGGPRLLFVDGRLDRSASEPGAVVLGPAGEASAHPLARLATGEGWTLAVDSALPAPVEIVHVSTGGANHLPARIALAEGAQAAIVVTCGGVGWAYRLSQIALGRGARLKRAVRLLQATGFVSLRDEAEIGPEAHYAATVLGAGGAGSRIDAALVLAGKGAFADMGGALLARGEQRHEGAIVMRHALGGGVSRQVWRAVADDSAAASIASRVEVARDAQKTDGEQSLRGLLLKRSATVNLKPELEIFADDVKCAHGAAVGELDARALFYLESRGIPPEAARALLTYAFVVDALELIDEGPVRDAFVADAARWLDGEGQKG